MAKPKLMKEFEPGHGFTKQDWDDVSDTPEWTEEDFKNARPFSEVFPELAQKLREGRAGGFEYVGVDLRVIEKLDVQGDELQRQVNEILRKAVGL